MKKNMKLALVYPNQRWQKFDMNTTWNLNPVTLALLASMVKELVEVVIIDANHNNLTIEEFKEKIIDEKPNFVGVSLMTSEYQNILDISVNIIKSISKGIYTIVGGVHVTTNYITVMKNPNIDFAVLGEGEYTLKNLLIYLMGQGPLPEKGLCFRHDGKLVVQEQMLVDNLKTLPWPSYDLVDFPKYLDNYERKGPNRPPAFPALRTTVTRGCSFGCSFCQVELISGKKTRARDPEDIVNEFLYLKEKYGIKSIVFEDDNLLMAEGGRFAKKLYQTMIDKELNLPWIGTAFALFLLTDELLDLMQKSGCVGINVAVESGVERVLKQIVKKPIKDLAEVPRIIKKVQDRGMYCFANYIIGFPGETWEEIRGTFDFAEKANADYSRFFVAVPLLGTELFDMAKSMGVLMCDEGVPSIDWRYGQISSSEWTAQDISILRVYEWDRINFKPEKIEKMANLWGVSIDELNQIRKDTRDALKFI